MRYYRELIQKNPPNADSSDHFLRDALKQEGKHEIACTQQNGEERKVDEQKQPRVFFRIVAAAAVSGQRDEAGERRDGRAKSPDIDRDEQSRIIGGEFGEEHRRRHVGNKLTAERAEEQRVALHQRPHRLSYGGDPRHVSRKHEKRAERHQKAVVHFQKGFSVQKRRASATAASPEVVGKHAEYDHHRERKEHQIDGGAPRRSGARAIR